MSIGMLRSAPGLTFEPVEHKYFHNGVELPSVSSILKVLGFTKDYSMVDPWYAARGTATHKAIELYLRGELDESSVDPSYRGHFEGFKLWWKDKDPNKILASELSLCSARLKFAGTLDLVYGETIYDFKTSKNPDPVSELQGSGYQTLWGEYHGIDFPFRVLQLPGDGSFKEIDYRTQDPTLWESCMSLYRWLIKAHPRKK